MVIYADVLICVNVIMDYFLISLSTKLCKTACSFRRQLIGSTVGGLFALSVLLPFEGLIYSLFQQFFTAAVLTLIVWGFGTIKAYFRRFCCFMICSFGFSGAMLIVINLLKPDGMFLRGGVLYYQLSPIFLILSSAFCYFLITLISRFMNRDKKPTVRLVIKERNSEVSTVALVDSGNQLKEPFSEKGVLLLDPKYKEILTTNKDQRVIPFETVSGGGILMGFIPDKIELLDERVHEPLNLYVAFSNAPLQDFGAILPADAIWLES